jgi:hypothetical protein
MGAGGSYGGAGSGMHLVVTFDVEERNKAKEEHAEG